MKKLIAMFLLVCLLPLCAAAEMDAEGNVTVVLDGAEVFFTPIDGYCLTRESSASVFNRVGLSQREVVPAMEQEGIYAIMFDMALGLEVQIGVNPTADQDFDAMTAEAMEQLCALWGGYYDDAGFEAASAEPYVGQSGHQYVKILYRYVDEAGMESYSMEYTTCQAGYALWIVVYPFEELLTAEQIAQADAVADSVRITQTEVEDVTIPLSSGQLTFTPFRGGMCLTQDADESVFNWLGMDRQEVLDWMTTEDVDVLMYDAGYGCETWISVYDGDSPDWASYTAEEHQLLCDDFREIYEQHGYVVHDVHVAEIGDFTFLCGVASWTYEDGYEERHIVYETAFDGYQMLTTLFIMEGAEVADYLPMAEELMRSVRYTVDESSARLTAPGMNIRFTLPEGMTVHASVQETGVVLPEAGVGDVVGCMMAPAEDGFLVWRVTSRVTGDMEGMTEAAVRALYEARAKNKRNAGCTVSLSADHQNGRQRYIRTDYHFNDETGCTWYAVEYYTKQFGKGVSVTAYSTQPLTEDMLALLENIVNSQLITKAK